MDSKVQKYIALLRGINISGRNKVPMAELKKGFESLSFTAVRTWLNSGNVSFLSSETDPAVLTEQIEKMLQAHFSFSIPVFVLPQERLTDILEHAPDWWGTASKEIYDNLIFVMPPAVVADVRRDIGAPKEGLERIREYQDVIFWSFSRKDYQKTNWWPKTASAGIGSRLTIRTANTIRKIAEM